MEKMFGTKTSEKQRWSRPNAATRKCRMFLPSRYVTKDNSKCSYYVITNLPREDPSCSKKSEPFVAYLVTNRGYDTDKSNDHLTNQRRRFLRVHGTSIHQESTTSHEERCLVNQITTSDKRHRMER